jgi:hypothetical protein
VQGSHSLPFRTTAGAAVPLTMVLLIPSTQRLRTQNVMCTKSASVDLLPMLCMQTHYLSLRVSLKMTTCACKITLEQMRPVHRSGISVKLVPTETF